MHILPSNSSGLRETKGAVRVQRNSIDNMVIISRVMLQMNVPRKCYNSVDWKCIIMNNV